MRGVASDGGSLRTCKAQEASGSRPTKVAGHPAICLNEGRKGFILAWMQDSVEPMVEGTLSAKPACGIANAVPARL